LRSPFSLLETADDNASQELRPLVENFDCAADVRPRKELAPICCIKRVGLLRALGDGKRTAGEINAAPRRGA
jgi:hypothetical protein